MTFNLTSRFSELGRGEEPPELITMRGCQTSVALCPVYYSLLILTPGEP